MGISALNINNTQEAIAVSKPKQMNFRASGVNTLERNPQADTFDKPKKHTGLWVALGVLATAGLAIGFDFWKYKGQHCKDLWGNVKGILGKDKTTSPKPSGETPKITDYSLADFKKNGKFDKGKALLNDGSAYTGKINHTTKDGHNIVMEYENGLIKSSTKKNCSDIVWQKNYERSTGVDLMSNKKYTSLIVKDKEGKELLNRREYPEINEVRIIRNNNYYNVTIIDTENKRIKFKNKMSYVYDKDGVLKGIESGSDTIAFYPGGKTKRFEHISGVTTFYDKKGNIEAKFTNHKGISSSSPGGLEYSVYFPERNLHVLYRGERGEKEVHLNSISTRMRRSDRLDFAHIVDENGKFIGDNRGARLNINDKVYIFDDCKGYNSIVDIQGIANNGSYPIAKWNKDTNIIEILDGEHTEQQVREIIDNFSQKLKERITTAKKAHKKSINLINEYLNTRDSIRELDRLSH